MHQLINDILEKTSNRISEAKIYENRSSESVSKKRSILDAINAAKQRNHVAVISEVKPSSPREKIKDITPSDAAFIGKIMEDAGASAISVLTEPYYFNGSQENLESVRKNVTIPVLRKDFVIDEKQIDECENDIILLIAAILREKLPVFVETALSKGIEPLVEVHNLEDLQFAFQSGARLLGINNRDLNTLEVDIGTTEKLLPYIRTDEKKNNRKYLVVSESGIRNSDDARRMIKAGADALLVGTSIMKGDIYDNTKAIVTSIEGVTK
ncbi:indole-3-glycerol-phosphate synthase [Methanohalophilus sp.]|uniref:indole-3-glycerol-phosphate synthase n=1 Tax=Methanohalophilus sp. TaxID=1966352 RepID=UPI002621AB22|nr:indole-3-glycerol-phosphate synthase [Methanohalophilus sp.]MDK2892048.1 indole-3-glycerol phosphate synthase [Methanohalophilus sp.]